MCQRLCITFSLKELQALIQLKPNSNTRGPNYVELGTKLQPVQTYNATFSSPCPVLLSEKHIYDGIPSSSIVLAIMQWGLVPSWESEGKAKLKYRLTNVKKENLTRTKTLATLLKKGRRCALVCEGFYQIITLGNKLGKQAYFLHQQNEIDSRIQREIIQPCFVPAVFDIVKQSDQRDLFSFAIITVDTPSHLSAKLNNRLPSILVSKEDVLDWLDFTRVNIDDALKLLHCTSTQLQIDPVSNRILRKSNDGPECIEILSEHLVKDRSPSPSTLALSELESDIDEKVVEKHLEEIEKRHEVEIQHFIEQEELTDSQRRARHRSRSAIVEDTKEDENSLRSTLEALSERTNKIRHHHQARLSQKLIP